jgi:simple sugar transport system permease protein
MAQTTTSARDKSFLQRYLQPLLLPILAILTSFLIGALVIIFTAENPIVGLEKTIAGYRGLIEGAFLNRSGLFDTMVAMTPLILTGLAVAIPVHVGMFNIGAEGQFVMGALVGALAGIYLELPPVIHPIVVLAAGFVGGMLWGAIPGILKATLNSHEVINTIMLNFVAIYLTQYLVRDPIKDPNPSTVQSLPLLETAELPRFTELFGREIGTGRLHLGFIVALLMAVVAYYFLFRTTWGFSLRTTGLNPRAAEYAGIRPKREYILAMMLGGGMAGLAGILEVQGLSTRVVTEGIASGYGFDAIAVSFLALNQPLSIIPSAFVFGVLRVGSFFLQSRAGLSVHVVAILQALILLFVAAPAIIRSLYRVRRKAAVPEAEPAPLTQGWGG